MEHGHDDDDDHDGHDHGHDGHDHDHDHHDHEGAIELTTATWDREIGASPLVWAVLFHSGMCGSCKEFHPHWDALRETQKGLHWGEVNIDKFENVPLAKKYGVLKEGIPNIKLFAGKRFPLMVMTDGDTLTAAAVAPKLGAAIKQLDVMQDKAGFFLSKDEL